MNVPHEPESCFAWQTLEQWVREHPEDQLTRDMQLKPVDIRNLVGRISPNPYKVHDDEVRDSCILLAP